LRQGGFEPEDGGNAIVVGAGGVARAVVFGLLWSGTGEITVLNRTLARAQALVSDLGSRPRDAARLRALPFTSETLVESARAADLLVNATTLGMWPHVDASVWPDSVPVPAHMAVFDVVYNPLETRLLRQARESGARTIDGLGMLVRQGALAFDMWTNLGLAVDEIAGLMRPACERVLRK
jgi:shikimate dehydrogenase